jgi:hypothetical protein
MNAHDGNLPIYIWSICIGGIGVLCMIDSVMLIYTCIWYRREESEILYC